MPPKKKPGKLRGASRMKEQGYKLVNVWLDKNELAVIEKACELVGRKLATFIREAAFGSAGVVLDTKAEHGAVSEREWERMIEKNAKAVTVA